MLRDVALGLTKFDQLRASLGIAPNILSRRLRSLTEAGVLERRKYSERPTREEYLLTQAGSDFLPVLYVCPSSKHLAQIWRGGNGEQASSGVCF